MISPSIRPRIVIAGRPNVGKSTLFNRLYGSRRSITDSLPGVTRDAVEEKHLLGGIPVILVDTGGVKQEYDNDFDALVTQRSLDSFKKAHLILFLTERTQITAEDRLIMDVLRLYTPKVILVMNKADSLEKDIEAGNLYSLGFGEPIPISANHGRHIDHLVKTIKKRLELLGENLEISAGEDSKEEEKPLVLALVGKPNVGKSTLANTLTKSDNSLVSEIAGTTRDSIVGTLQYKNRRISVVDTAGIRRKGKVNNNIEYYSVNRAIRAMHQADVSILLIDAEEGLSEQDKKITTQALKKGQAIILALSKWDKISSHPKALKKITDRIHFQFPILEWAPLLPISSLSSREKGIKQLLETALELDFQQGRRIETGLLNRAFAEWIDFTPPPSHQGKPFKLRYITQVSTKPLRFLLFLNRKKNFPDSYRRYILNQIRREFHFPSVPIIIELRERESKR